MGLPSEAATSSTDAPVCDANPFPNIYTMLTRKTGKGTVAKPVTAQTYTNTQSLTLSRNEG